MKPNDGHDDEFGRIQYLQEYTYSSALIIERVNSFEDQDMLQYRKYVDRPRLICKNSTALYRNWTTRDW